MMYSNPVLNFIARNADFGVFRAARAESFHDYICAFLFSVRTTMITSGVHCLNSRTQFWRADFWTMIRCGLAITARQLLLVSCNPTYINYLSVSLVENGTTLTDCHPPSAIRHIRQSRHARYVNKVGSVVLAGRGPMLRTAKTSP